MATPMFSIGGLASGLDTAKIVQELMQVERIPVVRLQQRKTVFQQKIDAWSQIRTRLTWLRTAIDKLKTMSEVDRLVTATSSDPAVEATVTSAAPGSLSFTVDRLAAAHRVVGDTVYASKSDTVGAGTFTITTASGQDDITTSDSTTVEDLATAINGLGAGVKASLISPDGTSFRLMITADKTGAANELTASGIGTFTVVEQAKDSQVTIGSGEGALVVTRSSNTIDDLMPGVTLRLKATTTSAVNVSVDRDTEAAVAAVKGMVEELNATLGTLADLIRFDSASGKAGPLQGERTAWQLGMDLRRAVSESLSQLDGTYTAASTVGLTLGRDGSFSLDESKLRQALDADFDSVLQVFSRAGAASDARMSFVSASDRTVSGAYEVVVTQAATRAGVTAGGYAPPGQDQVFTISSGGKQAVVTIAEGSDLASAVSQINAALQAGGITTLKASDEDGNLNLREDRFGASGTFTVEGDTLYGLDGTHSGQDVAGTIDGVEASGSGRTLTASEGPSQGLTVRVTASQQEVDGAAGNLTLGPVAYSEGVAGRVSGVLGRAQGAEGLVSAATGRWQSQIDLVDRQVRAFETRLALREVNLRRQFAAMESAMSTLASQASWLASQLASMASGQ